MAKFFYTRVFTEPKESYAKTTQLGITFTSGYLTGVVCTTVSHPADSVVSLIGKPANEGKSIGAIALETGFAALATKGLGTHVLMIGTLTGEGSTIQLRVQLITVGSDCLAAMSA
jgi:solute carrier family 25 phosphate transporter 3